MQSCQDREGGSTPLTRSTVNLSSPNKKALQKKSFFGKLREKARGKEEKRMAPRMAAGTDVIGSIFGSLARTCDFLQRFSYDTTFSYLDLPETASYPVPESFLSFEKAFPLTY